MNILYSLDMDKPILSIIIPVYNVEKYIKQCLDSIFNQHVDNNLFEVIIVNDGTPDDSMFIATPIVERMGNATIINQENQGLSAARNAGLKRAKGEYVWFVDSDDFLLENALCDVFDVIKNQKVDVISSVLRTLDESSGRTGLDFKKMKPVKSGKDYLFKGYKTGAIQRFVFSRDFLERENLQFMVGVYHEDDDFGHRMMYLAKTVTILDRPVYCYLLRSSGSIMSTRKIKMNYDLVKIYFFLLDFCEKKVEKKDEWRFKAEIFGRLTNTVLFSRRILYTDDFIEYYNEYKSLIHQKAKELLLRPFQFRWLIYRHALHMYYFPLCYTKLKSNLWAAIHGVKLPKGKL